MVFRSRTPKPFLRSSYLDAIYFRQLFGRKLYGTPKVMQGFRTRRNVNARQLSIESLGFSFPYISFNNA